MASRVAAQLALAASAGVVGCAGAAGAQIEDIFKSLLQRAFSGQLTAEWRQAHLQELLVEMQEQVHLLNLPAPN